MFIYQQLIRIHALSIINWLIWQNSTSVFVFISRHHILLLCQALWCVIPMLKVPYGVNMRCIGCSIDSIVKLFEAVAPARFNIQHFMLKILCYLHCTGKTIFKFKIYLYLEYNIIIIIIICKYGNITNFDRRRHNNLNCAPKLCLTFKSACRGVQSLEQSNRRWVSFIAVDLEINF